MPLLSSSFKPDCCGRVHFLADSFASIFMCVMVTGMRLIRLETETLLICYHSFTSVTSSLGNKCLYYSILCHVIHQNKIYTFTSVV